MRRKIRDQQGKEILVTVTWEDHEAHCTKCQQVILDKTATYALACAEGSPLLAEKAVELQRPAETERKRKVLEWAKAAGVFKIPR